MANEQLGMEPKTEGNELNTNPEDNAASENATPENATPTVSGTMPTGAPATTVAPVAPTPWTGTATQALAGNVAGPIPGKNGVATVAQNQDAIHPIAAKIRGAAETMTGGPRYETRYDANGNAVRTKIPVSPAMLGLSLAMQLLSGGMAGGTTGANQPGKAFEAGAEVAAKRKADIQQANINQDAQAKADQDHKLAVTKSNLQIHQLALNVGKEDLETNQAYVNALAPQAQLLESYPELIKGDITEDQVNDGLKAGKYNITQHSFIPHGDPYPILDSQTGKQKEVDGVPVWGHNYYVVDASAKAELTKDIQDQGYKIGKFRNPDGSQIKLPTDAQYPLATILQQGVQFAQIQTAEEMLEDHKNDILGDKAGPRVSLADQVASNPRMMQAVEDYSHFIGAGEIDQIFAAMMQKGAGQSAAMLMKFMGVTPDDIRKAENARIQEHTEATTKEKQETSEDKALKVAQTQASLSTIGRNAAEVKKLNAETDKLLSDAEGQSQVVDAIGTGHIAPDRLGYIIARKPELLGQITAKYPDFDSSKAESYPKVYADYTSQKRGSSGAAINSGGTAFQHLQELIELNTAASHIPHTPAYTAYKNKMDTVVSELGQFYGNTTIPGLGDFKNTLDTTLPGNREAAIRTQAKSMSDKMNSYEHGWVNGAPSAVYQAPLPGLSHDALVARAKLDPTFKTRPPEGAAGQESFGGKPYWVNAAHKKLQEVVQ